MGHVIVDLQTLADSMDADDYPGSDIIRAASAEIDNLRRWKAEAMQVLTDWQQCYATLAEAGHPAPLGMSMARHVAGYLKVTA